ncbi:hypothetical protein ANTHELSMS3_01886 [Antarctobacter heliothermus]|uniref:Uncharacterized protein n=1 Tax=Antarctobacter heliothermus TaxID=74033 RepID=A0A222E344_9RHOB|nr:hypothetical protein [Antarctobacter heliothermus]ASP20572.1 hypothetical protein ANTHELSMS3_01886 [Antarctobacter heliothermus]
MSRRVYLLLTVVTLSVYFVMVLWTLPKIAAAAGGLLPFDLRPWGYTPEEAAALLSALSEAGRTLYSDVQLRLDTVYPPLLAVWICASAARLFPRSVVWAIGLVAVVGMAADLAENAAVARLLDGFDAQTAQRAARWTLVKSAATTVALAALLAGFVAWLWRKGRGRTTG